ncbi:Vga family ABC-F type ribosomal protection protein [Mesobacillus maritimus]|uniref:Vga family ABC-F type ribosomal protection protein n=1 Tax=Mesobacillus maritimus TaxID=1643336 RepID=A0ABS7K5D7_9BACI|nr:Vga family ABC-F type ribosomal protection protein [Mesobacillus maritimus]MBY0097424.1 Vga family ABC-F type ribosomal protection protein [Mesobacillus maritimus]
MIRLEANSLRLSIKDRVLLDVERLQVGKEDRIGLVGRNGSGKTTLLEVFAGLHSPEEGTVTHTGSVELLPQLKRNDTHKSGGEVTQEYINKALVRKADLLLADEPTTHLDTEHIEWLEKKLKRWQGALILVSHDRVFLDAICTKIWEIHEGKVKEYPGNYSAYAEQKEVERRQHEQAYEKYEKQKQQLEDAIKLKEKKAARATKAPKKVSPSEARITGAKPYFAKKQKKLEKTASAFKTRLEKLDKVDKVKEVEPVKMNLPNEETFKGRIVLRVENVGGVVGKRVLWKPVSFTVKGGEKLAIIGPNGSGKTTLVKKILQREAGITVSPAVQMGYFSQTIETLVVEKSILENVSSTSVQTETFIRTVLARLHFYREDVYKPVQVLSGGERIKVALAKLFVSEINTLILDEPTNFLDLDSVEALESLLQDYEGTIIFVSHDRRFIEKVGTRILVIENKGIHVFEGTYEEYKNYEPQEQRDHTEDKRMLLETKITEVLSRLSIAQSEELEKEFQTLLAEKRALRAKGE